MNQFSDGRLTGGGIQTTLEDGVLVIRVPIRVEAHMLSGELRLSPRRRQVLQGMIEGKANKEIAAELNISERTVKHHASLLLEEFGCATRGELAFKQRSLQEAKVG